MIPSMYILRKEKKAIKDPHGLQSAVVFTKTLLLNKSILSNSETKWEPILTLYPGSEEHRFCNKEQFSLQWNTILKELK